MSHLERYRGFLPAGDFPQVKSLLEPRPAMGMSGKRSWYTVKNLSETEAEILIYDYIGIGGVSASDFVHELGNIKADKIALRVNSPGGMVTDGIAIYNAIQRHKADVTAYVDGMAGSAASFIIMAADAVVMSPHSQIIIHDAHGVAIGPASEMIKMADDLDKISDNIASMYAERAGGTTEEWRALMKEETFISDKEAVRMGLADRVEGDEETVKDIKNEVVKPELDPEPEPVSPPVPVDWARVMNDITEEAEEEIFA